MAIFVHGCFWHVHQNCRFSKIPETRQEFWTNKLSRNVQRDLENREALLNAGWRVLVVWECATRRKAGQQPDISDRLIEWIQDETNRAGEIGSLAGHASDPDNTGNLLARRGGTAFPTCVYCSVLFPEK